MYISGSLDNIIRFIFFSAMFIESLSSQLSNKLKVGYNYSSSF